MKSTNKSLFGPNASRAIVLCWHFRPITSSCFFCQKIVDAFRIAAALYTILTEHSHHLTLFLERWNGMLQIIVQALKQDSEAHENYSRSFVHIERGIDLLLRAIFKVVQYPDHQQNV